MRQHLIFILLAAFSTFTCAASEPAPCDGAQLGTAAQGDCLAREYKRAVAQLDKKLQQVLADAGSTELGFSNPEIDRSRRASLLKAIRDAHRAWQTQVEAECNNLLAASFGIGNGAYNASAECRINMTHERIGYLSSSPSYAWLR